MPLTVMVVAGGGFQGLGILEAVHAIPGVRAIVLDSTTDAPGELFVERYVVAPPLEAPEFPDFLLETVRGEGVTLVLPATQRELRVLATLASELKSLGADAAVCSDSLLDVLLDKHALYRALGAAGFPVQQPVDLTPEAPFPLFGRPRAGWGGRDVHRLRGPGDLSDDTATLRTLSQSHVWVPWLGSFDEFSADFAIDFRGDVSRFTLRRRVRTSGGYAVVSDSEDLAQAEILLQRLAGWLAAQGGAGLFNVQLLLTPDDGMLVSDINPRHGTSSGHALAEGNSLVAFLLGCGRESPRRFVRTVRSLAQQVLPRFPVGSIRGVVFDLDDTLLDHKRWIIDRMRIAADSLAGAIDPTLLLEQAYLAVEEGEHARLIDVITERLRMPALHPDLLAAYRAAVPARAVIFPEVADVLALLRAQGLKLAILTDNPPASQRAKLAACEWLERAFDVVVFSRDCGAEKPSAEPFRQVADRLGLPAASLLMVGDNAARDALGAVRAGWLACMLIDRAGGRSRVHLDLMGEVMPDVAERTWIAPDLRALPLLQRIAMPAGEA